MLQVGPYKLASRVVLAPMAGVSDLPFRQLCRRFGAGLVVSEMVTSDTRLWHTRKSRNRLNHAGEAEPRSVQIAGGGALMMAEAARLNVERGAQIIDINMGCPAKKVCNKAAGSALMKDQRLVADILQAVVAAVDVPVTLKIRTGWSPNQRNGLDIARIAQDSGIAVLAVHGRTRACGFNGEVEYDTIAEIKAAISIPVIANGDIDSPQKALQVMQYTGADAIMIGRAAQGRPWLCREINQFLCSGDIVESPDHNEVRQILLEHLNALYAFYGECMGVKIARKHVGWYLKVENAKGDVSKIEGKAGNLTANLKCPDAEQAHRQQNGNRFRSRFNQLQSAHNQRQAIDDYFGDLTKYNDNHSTNSNSTNSNRTNNDTHSSANLDRKPYTKFKCATIN
ncbi:MAG: tRNA dihydrouridine synthase DusB [Pseudomonadales bacterium]